MISKTKLKKNRLLQAYTQESLSEASGISVRTIQRIEKGISEGSPHTLKALAQALNIEISELQDTPPILVDPENTQREKTQPNEVKLLNLSSISLLIIPFGNLLFPLALFLFGKGKKANEISLTRKIFSYQILFTLLTITLMLLVPLLLLGSFEVLKASKIPLAIPVYYLAAFINTLIILQTSIQLTEDKEILSFTPNLL